MGRLYIEVRPPFEFIETTANSLPDDLRTSFLQQVSDLVQGLLPDDLVFTGCGSEGINRERAAASSASDNCIGFFEIAGLRELCASAVGASDVRGT
jgi:hypothetical protein